MAFTVLTVGFPDLYHRGLHTRSAVVRNLCVSYRLSCLDMSQSMLQIIRVTRPSHARFLKFYLSIFEKLFICIRMPNFKYVALRILEIYLTECQILLRSRDPGHAPILNFYLSILEKLSTCAYAKFEVCSFTRFGDMFEGVPNFIRVT